MPQVYQTLYQQPQVDTVPGISVIEGQKEWLFPGAARAAHYHGMPKYAYMTPNKETVRDGSVGYLSPAPMVPPLHRGGRPF